MHPGVLRATDIPFRIFGGNPWMRDQAIEGPLPSHDNTEKTRMPHAGL